jgi:galactonate dehydratase
MYRNQYFEGGRVLTAAIAGIDIALHDIVGKALGVPAYQLLGGSHRDYVPCFAMTSAGSLNQLIEDVKLLLNNGWNAIRTWMARGRLDGQPLYEPRESIGLTAQWLTQLRQEVGPEPVIGIDYHHRLSVAEAASFCQRMPAGTLDFLEEPIRDETPEAYESLRTMIDVPLAIGEEFSSKWTFLPYIERGITNFVRLDVCNVGGLTEAMKIASMAESHYIDLMPHNPLGVICTAASAHLAAAVPNFAWLEIRDSPTEQLGHYSQELFPIQPQREGSHILVSDRPGIGVEVDEHLAAQRPLEIRKPGPLLRRRDGSLTNS